MSRAIPRELLPDEEWRPIPGWPGYEVSNLGRLYSVKRPRVQRSGRILRTQAMPSGYRTAAMWRDGRQSTVTVHSLVLAAFVGPRPNGLVIRHLDGEPSNNRADNLAYGTYAENAQDMLRHGRNPNAAKTHCKHGHPFDEENTYVAPRGTRECRTCKQASRVRAA